MLRRLLFWVAVGFAILIIPPALGLIGPVELSIMLVALAIVLVLAVRDLRRARTT